MTPLEHLDAAEQVRRHRRRGVAEKVRRHYAEILERLKAETPDKDTLAGRINAVVNERERADHGVSA